MSSQIQPHDVVGASHWLKLRAGVKEGRECRDGDRGGLTLPEGRKIVDLWILGVYIEIIISRGDLVICLVDMVFRSHWWRIRFGWGSDFLIPKSQVFKDLLDRGLYSTKCCRI